ncbi:hypothetical protein ACSBR1_005844 [Camellia fascicularis]
MLGPSVEATPSTLTSTWGVVSDRPKKKKIWATQKTVGVVGVTPTGGLGHFPSQNFCRSIPARVENLSLSRLCYRRLWESQNRRALILGWVPHLDVFSSYSLHTWLPSIYRGHDN